MRQAMRARRVMSAKGHKLTSALSKAMSAFGRKADMPVSVEVVCL
jgi:hypothetical protein